MSSKNDFEVHSKHLRVEGNEIEGYRVIWFGKIVKHTRELGYAMDIAFALLVGDEEQLIDYGIDPQEVMSNA